MLEGLERVVVQLDLVLLEVRGVLLRKGLDQGLGLECTHTGVECLLAVNELAEVLLVEEVHPLLLVSRVHVFDPTLEGLHSANPM
jgi:hypothetical protein